MLEAHIRALEQSTMIALTLFASQSKQIIIKILDLKDILGLYCGIKVVIQCQIFDVTLSQYIVIRIAIRPCLSQYITIHFLVAIPIPTRHAQPQPPVAQGQAPPVPLESAVIVKAPDNDVEVISVRSASV